MEPKKPHGRRFVEPQPKFIPPKRDTSWWLTASRERFTELARREIHQDDRIFTLTRLTAD